MCEPAGSEDLVYHSKLSPLEQSLTITMYYVSENLFYLYVCECVYSSIFQPCDEIISTFCCKGITLGFFYHFVNVLSIKCHTKK